MPGVIDGGTVARGGETAVIVAGVVTVGGGIGGAMLGANDVCVPANCRFVGGIPAGLMEESGSVT